MQLKRKIGFYEKYIKRLLDILCSGAAVIVFCCINGLQYFVEADFASFIVDENRHEIVIGCAFLNGASQVEFQYRIVGY